MIDSILIGPHRWTVRESSDLDDAFGMCNREGLEIIIKEGLEPSVWKETFLHEVLHACVFGSGLRLDDDEEERVVSILAPQLKMAIEDNKTLFEKLGGAPR